MRRRTYMERQCSLLVGHILNTNTQNNLPAFNKKLSRKFNHDGVAERFATVQRFCSYARLIRPEKESDGKWAGKSNKKIGNAHLKWAIRTAAMVSLRESDQAKKYVDRLSRKYNKGKALGIYTHKLGRAVYFMLKKKELLI